MSVPTLAVEPAWPGWGRMGARYLAVLTVLFLLAGVHIARLLQPASMQAHLWGWRDVAVLPAGLLLLAGAATGLGSVLRAGRPWRRAAIDHLYMLALGAGLLTNLWFYTLRSEGYHIGRRGVEMSTLWLLLAAGVGFALARRDRGWPGICRRCATVLSPAVFVVFVQLLNQPGYPAVQDPFPPVDTAAPANLSQELPEDRSPAPPIYLVVFDEWSYPRSFEAGLPVDWLTHLSRFAERSMVFETVHAVGEETFYSMPGLLFQTHLPAWAEQGRAGFESDGQILSPDRLTSIFDGVRGRDYRAGLVGFALPYDRWLAGRVDYVRTYAWQARGYDLPSALAYHGYAILATWTDPWSQFVRDRLSTRVPDSHFRWMYDRLREDVRHVLCEQPARSFVVIHLPYPHHPYILDEQGGYRGARDDSWDKSDWPGYRRNLQAMDRELGRMVADLESVGRFDDALVILTADHGWRNDPRMAHEAEARDLRRVPLLVKLPRQRSRVSVTTPFLHTQLGELLEQILAGGDTEACAAWIAGNPEEPPESYPHDLDPSPMQIQLQ